MISGEQYLRLIKIIWLFLDPIIADSNCVRLDSWAIRPESLTKWHRVNSGSAEPLPSLKGNALRLAEWWAWAATLFQLRQPFPGTGALASFGKCSCLWEFITSLHLYSCNLLQKPHWYLISIEKLYGFYWVTALEAPAALRIWEWLCVLGCTDCAFRWQLTWVMGRGRVIY